MSRFVYCAYPIDQISMSQELVTRINEVKMDMLDQGVQIVYDPGDAFIVRSDAPLGREIAHLNQVALGKATGVLAWLPKGGASIGVPQEIDRAARNGVPVAVISNIKSWSLVYGDWVRQFEEDSYFEAGRWLAAHPANKSIQSQDNDLLVKVADGGKAPTKAHEDDAGWDLYVQNDVVIEPGEFRDIDCGVAVRFPAGVYGVITGRSSTLRKRGLLVNQGIIDTGYTGPLFAGVYNLGSEAVLIEKDERVAQMLLHSNYRWIGTRQVEDLGHTSRGSQGFGSSGY